MKATEKKFPGQILNRGVVVLFFCLWLCLPAVTASAAAKNVILMIMDGGSFEQLTLARWVKGAPLALDDLLVGAVQTACVDAVVPDSAAAATAFACGQATRRGVLGLVPGDPGVLQPRATILEAARLQGKATGIVVTSRLSHATPAAFYAHVPSRRDEATIMQQLVYQNLALAFGGGRRWLRTDWRQELERRGCRLLSSRAELLAHRGLPVLGLFADDHLVPEIDRAVTAPEQPSLAEMTAKALALLADQPQGFFLLVEGSQIDFAAHVHDPGYLLGELLQFDAAVQLALDFARRDGQTLLVVTADHATGGFSLGNDRAAGTTQPLTPEALLAPLRPLKASARRLWQSLGARPTAAALRQQLAALWGVDLSPQAAQELVAAATRPGADPECLLSDYFCQHYTLLGWSTRGHTGGEVPLFAYGPGKPGGLLTAPALGRRLAAALAVDLDEVSRRLFAPVTELFPESPHPVGLSATSTAILLHREDRTAQVLLNTNLLLADGRDYPLEGLVLACPPGPRFFLPRQVTDFWSGRRN